jgi:hypothetical protein
MQDIPKLGGRVWAKVLVDHLLVRELPRTTRGPSPYRYAYRNEIELRIPTYMHHHTNWWWWKTQRQRRLGTKYLPKRRRKILPKVPRPCSCKVKEKTKKKKTGPKDPPFHSPLHRHELFLGLVLGTCVQGYYIIRRIICRKKKKKFKIKFGGSFTVTDQK